MKHLLSTAIILLVAFSSFGQSQIKVKNEGVLINDNTKESPLPDIILDVDSNNKGVVFPRLTTIQRDNLQKTRGLLIYNLDVDRYQYWNGTLWLDMGIMPIPPNAPSDLVATPVNDIEIQLSWTDNSDDESGFEISRSLDGSTYETLLTTQENVVQFVDTNLSPYTQYFYRVRATNGAFSEYILADTTTRYGLHLFTDLDPATDGTFDPHISYYGSGTVKWIFEDGSEINSSNISTSANGLDGTAQLVRMLVDEPSKVSGLYFGGDQLINSIDLSHLTGIFHLSLENNGGLNSVTYPTNHSVPWNGAFRVENCSLSGILDLTWMSSISAIDLRADNNSFNGLAIPPNSTASRVWFSNNSLTGTIDLSNFIDITLSLGLGNNSITNLILPNSASHIFSIVINDNDLTGHLDLSPLAGGFLELRADNNPNLTSITLPVSTNTLRTFNVSGCNLTSVDMSGMTGLNAAHVYGVLAKNNPNLTSFTLPAGNVVCGRLDLMNSAIDGLPSLAGAPSLIKIDNARLLLANNSMTSAQVNETLTHLATGVNSETAGGDFVSRRIEIHGANAAPDSSSGGFDGLAAIQTLESKGITVVRN